jgi:hypothetical protein
MILLLLACRTPVQAACDDICEELYVSCRYDAFPSLDSCLQGCLYDAENGLDVEPALACFEDARCDTFEILNCQNRFGTDASD